MDLKPERIDFLTYSKPPPFEHLPQMIDLFDLRKQVSRACPGDEAASQETESVIEEFEIRARWRCLTFARQNILRPWVARKWINAVEGFDPRNGGLAKIALRFARRGFSH